MRISSSSLYIVVTRRLASCQRAAIGEEGRCCARINIHSKHSSNTIIRVNINANNYFPNEENSIVRDLPYTL
jgi:hypothetical protein